MPLTGTPKWVVLLQVEVSVATGVAVSAAHIRFAHTLACLCVTHIAACQRAWPVTGALWKQTRFSLAEC